MSYTENEIIVPRNVEDEMKESYLALFDVGDYFPRSARCARWTKTFAATYSICDAPA